MGVLGCIFMAVITAFTTYGIKERIRKQKKIKGVEPNTTTSETK